MNIGTAPPAGSAERQAVPLNRAGWHLRANIPVLFWLVALVAVVLVHRFVPDAGWLMVHLLLLGAVTNAVVVWSSHFAQALLRGPEPARRWLVVRLAVLNAGVAAVVVAVPAGLWGLTLTGSLLVGTALAAHAAALGRRARAALPSRFGPAVRYYVAAAALLPAGAGLGAALASGVDGEAHARLLVTHVALNLLGFVGLTVLGTLMTLLPTMLRTRVAEGAELVTRRALAPLLAGVLLTAFGAAAGSALLAATGTLVFLAGTGYAAVPLLRACRQRPPSSFAALSALAALGWLAAGLAWLAGIFLAAALSGGSWEGIHRGLEQLVPLLAAGFAAQVLGGALSYLLPVVLGGGPARVKYRTAVLDRAAVFRVVLTNAGLLLGLLPVPSFVRVGASFLVLIGLAWFLPLLAAALRRRPVPADGGSAPPRGRGLGMAAAGLTVVVLTVVAGTVADPAAVARLSASAAGAGAGPASGAAAPRTAATGHTTTVRMTMKNMRFSPAIVRVPTGDRLVIQLANEDSMVHDLVTASGAESGRLYPGESTTVDAGIITGTMDGWCSVIGHRQQGMTFTIAASPTAGASPPAAADPPATPGIPGMAGMGQEPGSPGAAAQLDVMKDPGPGFTARNPALPPAPAGTVHAVTLTAREAEADVAAGVRQRLWTFNGTAPGPTLRGKVGDTFRITLKNEGSTGHSIDFHAGSLAPDKPMRTIEPGQSLTYTFKATRAGIWLYHCGSMPMSLHIANGMFGAVIIDPPGLPKVDREYLLVQSEFYLGAQGGIADAAKIKAGQPDAVVFNGYASQYDFRPLPAKVGERVRVWVLAAGPNRGTSFHVVGGQFDTVWAEGRYLLEGTNRAAGAQALSLGVAQGGFVELAFPEAGRYPFLTHAMADAEKGARGVFQVAR